ncbi:uncharacterized protein LY89DRAFT_789330 [Mollisia scopiformis]|uniref:Cyclin-like domain-containing protein n=1 Tax=Mollisia scopiformis TaxID=149040 RepID=A0A132B6Q5_MOLSC|nr:uncharacterized protein LY89DRAFT_789330 [Mollisia scopiformis]KUJ08096.1 hypothetical protein LY89DRAFT_789330 [Mollisia scopiformis]
MPPKIPTHVPPINPLKNRHQIKNPPAIKNRQSTPARKPRPKVCPNKQCNSPNIDDGICTDCGYILDDSNIVAEVQFGETANGAAMVQGTYIGADQGGAASMGIGGRGDGQNNRQQTLANGKALMVQLMHQLNLNQPVIDAGHQIFKLAANANFIQGRRADMVAVVCLYSACRKSRPCRVMLIDFADKVNINVFKLGATFKALHKAIPIAADGIVPVLPEDLIHRFAQKLEFDDLCDKVAEDAIRMVKRMSLDWMVMGRRPSGVCGACLILAARMNNFRRTITEVVYIVKVTTNTIQKRLEEFKLTPSSALTVEDFLHNEFLESAHDPPSFYEKTEEFQKTKKRRKRKGHEALDNEDGSSSENGSPNKRQKTATPGPDQHIELRRDADGFAIPPIPNQANNTPAVVNDPESNIDPSLRSILSQTNSSSPPPAQSADTAPSRTSPGISDQLNTPPSTQSAEPLLSSTSSNDTSVQSNITPPPSQTESGQPVVGGEVPDVPDDVLDDQTETTFEKLVAAFGDGDEDSDEDEEVVQANPRSGKRGPDHRPIRVDPRWASVEEELEQEIDEVINDPNTIEHAERYAIAKQRAAVHMIAAAKNNPQKEVSMDVHIGEDEFKDDPEVMYCLLSAADSAVREQVWVNNNKAWLRKQQLREWERKAAENGPPKAKRNRKKKPRMGENQTSAANSPAEATQEALQRHTYSKKINYDAIQGLFDTSGFLGGGLGSAATSRVTSQAGSELGSDAGSRASSVAPSTAGGDDSEIDTDPLSLFPIPKYLQPGKRYRNPNPKRQASRSASRASPAPRTLLPRPSAEPESSRSSPAPAPEEEEEEDMDEDSFDYVSTAKAAPARQEEVVDDWKAALKAPKGDVVSPDADDDAYEDEDNYDMGDIEPGGLGDFDDEEEPGGFDVDEDMADYQ